MMRRAGGFPYRCIFWMYSSATTWNVIFAANSASSRR